MSDSQAGCLWVCATPIGNLEDASLRLLRVLREADRVAAEDTRRTQALLEHFGIRTPLVSCHEHNEEERAAEVVSWIRAGLRVALVSDAGTPGIADPGARVVAAVAAAGLPVIPVPGPSAVTAALSASGIAANAFVFAGFPPRQGADRERLLERIALEEVPVVLYESGHRISRLLEDLARELPDRQVFIAREITKRFEESLRGTPGELLDALRGRARGEFVLVIAPATTPADHGGEATVPDALLREEVALLVRYGFDEREAMRRVARAHRIPRQRVYRAVHAGD